MAKLSAAVKPAGMTFCVFWYRLHIMIVRAAAMHRLVTVAGLYVQQDNVSNTLLVMLATYACLSSLERHTGAQARSRDSCIRAYCGKICQECANRRAAPACLALPVAC